MVTLTKSDVRDVIAIHECARECRGVEEVQDASLAALQRHLCCDAALFIVRSGRDWTQGFERLAQRGLVDEFGPRYLAGPYADDPLAPHVRENPDWRFGVTTSEKLVPRRQWMNSRLCQELLLPAGVFHMLCLELVVDRRQIGLVGLFRSMDAGPFLDRDESKAGLCANVMAQALSRALDADAESARDRHLANVVSDATGVGIVVLDARLQFHHRTRAAESMLDQIAPHAVSVGTGVAPLPPVLHRVAAALRRDVMSAPNSREPRLSQALRIPTAKGVICASVSAVRVIDEVRYIVSLRSETAPGCDKTKLLRIGLSPREADVVMSVVGGLRNSDIAEQLGVSVNTVQTHLRSVFSKLDVHNRAGLLSRVLCDRQADSTRPPRAIRH